MRLRKLLPSLFLVAAAANGQFNFTTSLIRVVVDSQNRDTLWGHTQSASTGINTLYRSTDQGKSWRGIAFSPTLGAFISRIRVHPDLGGRVFVLTTAAAGSLWTSTDNGATWKNPGAGWPTDLTAQQVVVAPSPSQLVYVQIGQQLRRSTDGGVTFDAGVDTPCSRVPIEGSPSDPRRLVCASATDSRFYISTDEGRTWTPGAKPVAESLNNCTVVNDLRNVLVYWVYCSAILGGTQRDLYYRSTDGLVTLLPSAPSGVGLGRFFVSPDRSTIIATGAGPNNVRSRDLGQTWETLGASDSADYAFDPSDANIVYRSGSSRSVDGGRTFTSITPRTYVPIFPTPAPFEVTLETGTGYVPTIQIRDIDNTLFRADQFTLTTTAPWLSSTPSVVASAAGLSAGVYEGNVTLNVGGAPAALFPIKMTVVAPRDPPIFMRATRAAGNGTRVLESNAAAPFTGDGGPALSAPLGASAVNLATDPDGNLYLAYQYRVMKVDTAGKIATYAGTGASGNTGNSGGATFATFQGLGDILYANNQLHILDWIGRTIRAVRTSGFIESFYTPVGFSGPSMLDDTKLAVDSAGNLFLADLTGVYKWMPAPDNTWQRLFLHADVAPTSSVGISAGYKSFTIDKRNDSFILAYTDRIVRRTTAGAVTILLGTAGKSGFAGDGNNSAAGSLTESPDDLAVDPQGNIFFYDHYRIRVITSAGVIGTVAGNGFPYSTSVPAPADNSLATTAGFGPFWGTHARSNGDIYAYSSPGYVYRLVAGPAPSSAIDPGGVVTLAGKARIAPGAIFSIYGKLLADGVVNDPTPPLKTKLGSASVQVNGADIPLFYVSPTQINAQMPYNVPLGSANVRVIRNGVATSDQTVQIVAASPDVIQYGAQRAVAVNQNGSVNAPGAGAPIGSYVVLYLTGIGVTTPALIAGQAAPGNPLAETTLPKKITLSNGSTTVDITPLFLGHTPTYAGLVQANFQIPNIAAGDYNLTLTVGGEPSNVTKLTVQ